MRALCLVLVHALFAAVLPIAAQTPVLAGGGYASPLPLRVAPGQVVTLYVTGTRTIFPPESAAIRATSVPLPAVLGGFSVTLRQGGTYAVPLFSVEQTPVCPDGDRSSPGCILTAITVQIPYELMAVPPGSAAPEVLSDLAVNDSGFASARFLIAPAVDNIHLLTVTHADGTPITADSPAKASEVLVLYGFGFGRTMPEAKTGAAAPLPAATLAGRPVVQFDFRVNAGPSRPYINPLLMTPVFPGPIFAGLTPGQVGLYQLNVRVPESMPAVPPCTRAGGLGSGLTGVVSSNLTINVAGVASFDGAAICVQPAL
jgi:uncharacterized protein (TIGR03437 family)